MPSEVKERDKMFSVRKAPWHLGVETTTSQVAVLTTYPGRDEAMQKAGHDFELVSRPLYIDRAGGKPFGQAHGWQALMHSKSGDILHVAKDSYEIVQPAVLWDLTETILEQKDVLWETAGTLKNGAVLWTLARVNKEFQVEGDDSPIYPFLFTTTTNDGTGGIYIGRTSVRVVCWNTKGAAEAETAQTKREFRFKHTKKVHERIEQARRALAGATAETQAFIELGNELVKVPFDEKCVELFTVEFIPTPPDMLISDRVLGNIEEARDKVRRLFFNSPTINDTIRYTGYGALQVGIEYLDHLRGYRSNATYLNRTLLRPEPLKDRLVPMIRRISDERQKVLALS